MVIYDSNQEVCIATHNRYFGKKKRIIDPSHYEKVLEKKPKARVVLYRDYLCAMDIQVENFISHICYRRRGVDGYGPDILKMYELFRRHGKEDFLTAVSLALEWESYGSEYLEYILEIPLKSKKGSIVSIPGIPTQEKVDRNLNNCLNVEFGFPFSWSMRVPLKALSFERRFLVYHNLGMSSYQAVPRRESPEESLFQGHQIQGYRRNRTRCISSYQFS